MDSTTEPRFRAAVAGHPRVIAGRYYLATAEARVLAVDQPVVGFDTEDAARNWLRDRESEQELSDRLTIVPASRVDG